MREIRYRAWNKKENRWATHNEQLSDVNVSASVRAPSIMTVGSDKYDLQMFTGLKDKNGVDIYEGDVVEMNSMGPGGVDLKGVVEMAEGSFYICSHENQLSTYLFNELSVIEIIGNIYEHPHLLEARE